MDLSLQHILDSFLLLRQIPILLQEKYISPDFLNFVPATDFVIVAATDFLLQCRCDGLSWCRAGRAETHLGGAGAKKNCRSDTQSVGSDALAFHQAETAQATDDTIPLENQ